jgi:hypothetical protein
VGAAALLFGLVALLRYTTWQGPVVLRAPDVPFLLAAPLDRAALVRRRLLRAAVLALAAGAVLGLGGFVLLELQLRVAAGPLLAAATLVGALLGALAAALGWLVECSARRATAVLRLSPAVLLLGAAAALALPRALLEWSGPWGWALAPVVAAAGGRAPAWPVQLGVLLAVTTAAVVAAWRGAGGAPTEELARRAGTRAGLGADLYVGDLRGAVLRRASAGGLLGVPRLRLPPPRRRWLALPWRGALSLLRAPGRVAWAALAGGGAVLGVAAAPQRRVLVAVAALAAYLAAARLVEPVRLEVDQPDAHQQLTWRYGELLLWHCLLPGAVLAGVGLLALTAARLAGLFPAAWFWPALVGCLPVAALLVLLAAGVGARGRAPVYLLALGDYGALALVVWFLLGPLLAETVLLWSAAVLRRGVAAGTAPAAAVGGAAVVVLLAAGVAGAWLRARQPPS